MLLAVAALSAFSQQNLVRATAGLPFDNGLLTTQDDRHGNNLTWTVRGIEKGRINLQGLLTDWLKDDARWGGHSPANQMRYMAEKGGGVSMRLLQLAQGPGGANLGLLNVLWDGPSVQPVAAQFLVHLEANPFQLWPIRSLPVEQSSGYDQSHPRLFLVGSKLFCIEDAQIDLLNWKGEPIRTISPWDPKELPYGIADNRWIVGSRSQANETEIDATDLTRGKTFAIERDRYDPKARYTPPQLLPGSLSANSPYVLLSRNDTGSGQLAMFTIHLPEGKRRTAPPNASGVSGPYVLCLKGNGDVNVYRASTGKLIRTEHVSLRKP